MDKCISIAAMKRTIINNLLQSGLKKVLITFKKLKGMEHRAAGSGQRLPGWVISPCPKSRARRAGPAGGY